ncbi:MAG: HAD-IC family P-type ATPase [Desulfobacteraceae bacterium]|nr:HAD-IC family P-type ATPase [Desulfobacteraceae bacterium]
MELLQKTDTVVFDKTGTLTLVQPDIAKIYSYNEFSEEQILSFAAAAEYRQTHPIAQAILQAAQEHHIKPPETDNIRYEVGYGIKADFAGYSIRVGSIRFMTMEGISVSDEISNYQLDCSEQGHSVIYVAVNNELAGAIELKAKIRPEVRSIVKTLQQQGKKVYIISGDHEKPTQQLAAELGINHYFQRYCRKIKRI